MTKQELKAEYMELWTLTNSTINEIRDTDTYTKERKYYKHLSDKKCSELYGLGHNGGWRLDQMKKSEIEVKIIEITELLKKYSDMLTEQLGKI